MSGNSEYGADLFDGPNRPYRAILEKAIAEGVEGAGFLAAFLELISTIEILNDDLTESKELFEFATHEFTVRTMIRTMAALYEAKLYQLQQLLLHLRLIGKCSLCDSDLVLLKGKRPKVNSHGKVLESQQYLTFQESLDATARVWSKIYTLQSPPGTGHPNWKDVQEFVKIRNRLMHPKRQSDLEVSDVDIASLNRAIDWFGEYFNCFFGKAEIR
jgi:hypothetical protein